MVIFDANMILRYLLDDNPEMAEMAECYINAGDVWVTLEVIAEVVYTLKGFYAMDRDVVSYYIKAFLELVDCQDREIANFALDVYRDHNLDLVDCVLYAYNRLKGVTIATFDKKLLKLINSNQ